MIYLVSVKMKHKAETSVTLYSQTPLFAFLQNDSAVSWHTLILNTAEKAYNKKKKQFDI